MINGNAVVVVVVVVYEFSVVESYKFELKWLCLMQANNQKKKKKKLDGRWQIFVLLQID